MELRQAIVRWSALVLLGLAAGNGFEMTAQTTPEAAAPPPAAERGQQPAPVPLGDDNLSPCRKQLDALTRDGYRPETLVVTLPDPLESHFAREFDVFLASLRRGLESQGYLQDRHCLAWSAAKPGHLEHTGMVLFRREVKQDKRVLALLTVGETPTWGVHPKALTEALELLRAIEGGKGADTLRVRVLGPTFSGSATSLGATVGDWIKELRKLATHPEIDLTILSGTASSPGNRDVILKALGCPAEDLPDCSLPGMRATYASAVTDNNTLQSTLLGKFVPRMLGKIPDGAVALLQESSVYGTSFEQQHYVVLPFPMHVSHLRAEYEKGKSGAAKKTTDEDGGQRTLSLALGTEAGSRDAIPVFDPEGTARSQDLVLNNILKTIARDRVQVVVIIATNVFDKLFLAEKLQQFAPDVRLMTFEGDLLLAHPDYLRATRGMVVASSYPLVSPDPLAARKGPERQSLQFASDSAQGIFEAARCLVGGDCGPASRHDVWISAVGNGNLVPIQRYADSPEDDGAESSTWVQEMQEMLGLRASEKPVPSAPPRGWSLIFSISTIVLALALGYVFTRLWKKGRVAAEIFELLGSEHRNGATRPRRSRLMRRAFLVFVPLVVAFPYYLLSDPYMHRPGLARFPAWATLLALMVASGFALLGLERRTRQDLLYEPANGPASKRWQRHLSMPRTLARVGFAGAVVLMLWIFYQYSLALSPDDVVLLLDRSIAFGNGLSPLVPIFLVLGVLVLWVALSLWRLRGFDDLPEPEDFRNEDFQSSVVADWRRRPMDLRKSLRVVRDAISPAGGFIDHRYAVPYALLLVAPLCYFAFYYETRALSLLRSVEPVAFDIVLSLLFTVAVTLTVSAGASMVRGWLAFSVALDRISDLSFETHDADKKTLWLEMIRNVCAPLNYSRRLIEDRRDVAFRNLRKAPAEGDLGEQLERCRDSAPDKTGHRIGAWLTIADWLGSQDAGAEESSPLLGHACELFAWQTTLVVIEIARQLRYLMAFMTAGLLLLLLMVVIYPFEPQRVLVFYLETLVVVGVAASLYVIFKMEKNRVLSFLTGTEPDKINWGRSLIGRLGLYAAVPVVSLLASGFPDLRKALLEWIEPLFKMFM